MHRHPRRQWAVSALAACLLAGGAAADEGDFPKSEGQVPVIALIIDDLGDRLQDGLRVAALPGQVTCAILPQTTFSRRLAEAVYASGKEVMLHQPMQSMNGRPMGPGGIDLNMSRAELGQTLEANLASVPHARGINNHMGSLLTRHPGQMTWFMDAVRERGGLYFVDSTTTPMSVARRIAMEQALPSMRRDIFLDNVRSETGILNQFAYLVARARRTGYAIGIGHPYPETLAALKKVLPLIGEFGVRLVPVSDVITYTTERREQLWQASLSPLQPAAKSLKP